MGILAGVAAVAAITWLRLALASLVGTEMPLLLYILAVLLAAWVGGVVAGVTTTVLSLAVGIALVIGPSAFSASGAEWIRAVTFMLEGLAISVMVELLQQRTKALRRTARELEEERNRIERMALEDQLTGLANRRAFDRDFERALARRSRDKAPLTLAMADIDGLKRVNDAHGHAVGDELLIATARALAGSCRTSDTVYRLGGDEFGLLMPGATRQDYEALHARIGSAFAAVAERFDGAGVSLGAAHLPEDGVEARVLMSVADARMYEAKAEGRAGA